MKSKKLKMMVLLAGLVLVVGACGNGAGNAGSEQTTTQTESKEKEPSGEGNAEETVNEDDQSGDSSGLLTDITLSDLQGEWFEIKSVRKLTLNADSTYKYDWTSGQCTLANGVLNIGPQFNVRESDGVIRLELDSSSLSDFYKKEWREDTVFMRFSDLPVEEYNIGDKASNEYCDITLTDVSFVEQIPDEWYNIFMRSNSNVASQLKISEGSVYAVVTYTYKNKQKNSIEIGDSDGNLRIALDYLNGFIFSTESGPHSLFTDGENASIVEWSTYPTSGVVLPYHDMTLQPLEEREFKTYIKCASDVETDTGSPLKVTFTTSSGSRDRFIVR